MPLTLLDLPAINHFDHLSKPENAAHPDILWGDIQPNLIRVEALADILEATAARIPNQLALLFEDQTLTYQELSAQADQVASHLIEAGVRPGHRVGLWLPRGINLLVMQAGITKAGAAWLPFDADTPVERIAVCLEDAGAIVKINNTLRPPERVHLMHYSYRVSAEGLAPQDVPTFPGVNIEWVHYTPALSVKRAKEMVEAYDIAFRPALRSNHTIGCAIDCEIDWSKSIRVKDGNGEFVQLEGPGEGWKDEDLWAVGETYEVYKLPADAPHWSIDGY